MMMTLLAVMVAVVVAAAVATMTTMTRAPGRVGLLAVHARLIDAGVRRMLTASNKHHTRATSLSFRYF
jgi:hypothetical protein